MNAPLSLLLPILLPLAVAAVVMPLLRRRPAAMAWTGLITVLAALLGFLPHFGCGHTSWSAEWVGAFKFDVSVTPWKAFLLGFMFLFQLMNGIYLLGALKRIPRPFLFMVFSLVALASACGVILTQNVLVLLVGWEMFLVSLYALILSGGEGTDEVAYKALIIGGASDFLMILGLMLYVHLSGSLDLSAAKPMEMHGFAPFMAWFLIFLGAGAKAGMYPFHTWIPQAAEKMPAPGFAALPASLEKILGIYFLFVVSKDLFQLSHLAQTVMVVFGVATIFVAYAPALVARNFKRVLALTAIGPVGFMVAGLGTSTAVGMVGALMYMLTHATYKSTMFYCAGNLEENAGDASLEAIENRKGRLTLTVTAFIFAFAAAISLPPTGGFMAKESILEGLLEHHRFVAFTILCLGAVANVAIFLKLTHVLTRGCCCKEKAEAPAVQLLPVIVLGLASLLGGMVFLGAGNLLGEVAGLEHHGWAPALFTHMLKSPLTVVSLAILLLGSAVFYGFRDASQPAHKAFEGLRTSPVTGRAIELAEAGTFDLYEVAIKVVRWLSNLVFLFLERKIEVVAGWLIRVGAAFGRRGLSGVHNGLFSNYLAWVIAGFALVLGLALLR